ncbi:MAG: SDR family oxidoreductase [Chloroflexi bacterium]|nr:SDR family oxidoreductase [Chloroflexota bacterium]
MREPPFKGKSVVITGASSGIGRELALQLARQGARLVLAARRSDRLEALAGECQALGAQALATTTDVTIENECAKLIARAADAFGGIDMLINNAGTAQFAGLADLPDLNSFRRVMDVNLYGTVYCTFYALPHLTRSHGRLVNIASLGGFLAVPGSSSYAASKFGVVGFSDAVRMELASKGVSVTLIGPYWVVTELNQHTVDQFGLPDPAAGQAVYTKRMMTAERCAEITLRAAARRRRQVLMGPGLPAAVAKLLVPGFTDKATIAIFLRPALERMRKLRGDVPFDI